MYFNILHKFLETVETKKQKYTKKQKNNSQKFEEEQNVDQITY